MLRVSTPQPSPKSVTNSIPGSLPHRPQHTTISWYQQSSQKDKPRCNIEAKNIKQRHLQKFKTEKNWKRKEEEIELNQQQQAKPSTAPEMIELTKLCSTLGQLSLIKHNLRLSFPTTYLIGTTQRHSNWHRANPGSSRPLLDITNKKIKTQCYFTLHHRVRYTHPPPEKH